MKNYTAWQFTVFRIIFGCAFLFNIFLIFPMGEKFWNNNPSSSYIRLDLTYKYLFNILNGLESVFSMMLFLIPLLVCAVCILTGTFRRLASIILLFGWAVLFIGINLIRNPGISIMGWLLFILVAAPKGEPWCLKGSRNLNWKLPPKLFWGTWIFAGLVYMLSGLYKLMPLIGQNGSAMEHLFGNSLVQKVGQKVLFLAAPEIASNSFTWYVALVEIGFGILCMFTKIRPLVWCFMMGMHIVMCFVGNFLNFTIGLVVLHIFIIDPQWFKKKHSEQKKLVFFDGECIFCNGWVNFFRDIDTNMSLKFAALQGNTARQMLPSHLMENMSSIVLFDQGRLFTKSTAAIKIFVSLGGLWALVGLLQIVPKCIRDYIYDVIAKNRYKLFGKRDFCRRPTPSEEDVFLP